MATELQANYANYFEVRYNAVEFLFDFGQLSPKGLEPLLHTRIVTGPAFAKDLLDLLRTAIERCEAEFGPIVRTD